MRGFTLKQYDPWYSTEEEVLFEIGLRNIRIGSVAFDIDEMSGQCGAAILNDFSFGKTAALPTSSEFITTIRNAAKGEVGILLASAVVGSRLHKFLNVYPWVAGRVVINPNTNNRIQIFELEV